jgi:hypothetical protein
LIFSKYPCLSVFCIVIFVGHRFPGIPVAVYPVEVFSDIGSYRISSPFHISQQEPQAKPKLRPGFQKSQDRHQTQRVCPSASFVDLGVPPLDSLSGEPGSSNSNPFSVYPTQLRFLWLDLFSGNMEYFNESAFRNRVSIALQELKTVLENNRNPVLAESVPHAYNDKYLLAGAFFHILWACVFRPTFAKFVAWFT